MNVVLAGRIMSKRVMGKAIFNELQDSEGKIQIYVNRDEICKGRRQNFIQHGFQKTS